MTNLISTKRITTPTECVSPTLAAQLADAMELTGGNIAPIYVRDIGTAIDPQYILIQPDGMKQLSLLAAVRVLRDRDLKKYSMCNVVVVNPLNNLGERTDMEAAILAQL